MNKQKKGILFLLTGPSGVGKKTIWQPLINLPELKLVFSVSCTTRNKRPNEIEGVDYFFKTKEEFEKMIKNNGLLEYATYANNYYGTPKSFVDQVRKEGKNILLELEPQGGLNIIKMFKENKDSNFVSIFIAPENIDVLKERLLERSTESIDVITQRIKQAEWEIQQATAYQHMIINKTGCQKETTDTLYNIIIDAVRKNKSK